MVRWVRALVGLLAGSVSGAAQGQNVDWSGAGGDLLGRPPAEAEVSIADARLPNLDQPFDAAVAQAADRYGVDAKLLHAVIVVESRYLPASVSPAGAAGLMQLMPLTAVELGVRDRFDPAQNILGGADYLARQLVRFQDVRLALAAYNAGPALVAKLGRIPRIPETESYVEAVLNCYLALTAGRKVRSTRDCLPLEASR